jgi:hypothetical protein
MNHLIPKQTRDAITRVKSDASSLLEAIGTGNPEGWGKSKDDALENLLRSVLALIHEVTKWKRRAVKSRAGHGAIARSLPKSRSRRTPARERESGPPAAVPIGTWFRSPGRKWHYAANGFTLSRCGLVAGPGLNDDTIKARIPSLGPAFCKTCLGWARYEDSFGVD